VRRAITVVAMASSLLAASSARAGLDPASADAHARVALEKEGRAFCESPQKPLPDAQARVCPLAREVEGCEKLVAACEARDAEVELPRAPGFFACLARAFEVVGPIALWVLVAAIVLALLVPVILALRSRDRDLAREKAKPKRAQTAPVELGEAIEPTGDADALLRAGEASLSAGAFDRALFAFLRAALVALDRRGAVRIARDRTHGEYVRACKEADAKPSLSAIVHEVDRVRFGGEPASREAVQAVAARAHAIVRGAAFVATLAIALLTASCGRFGVRGADPSGPEAFSALLRAQGVEVAAPPGPLATLPLPDDPDRAPALVLDAERVPLDDDARAHLVRWVRAGGVLVLAGAPASWPQDLEARVTPASGREARFVTLAPAVADEDEDDERTKREDVAHLARGDAFSWALEGRDVATIGDRTYAAIAALDRGRVLAFANDDLFTNLGLARAGNAAPLVAALAELGRDRFLVARPENAASPPADPIAALIRAGLGLALAHAVALAIALFLANGPRLGRPSPSRPPSRRAFVEHVRAIGALYDRADLAPHALAAYGRFALERLRARLPRGESDVASFLASRSGLSREECEALVRRAREGEAARTTGDEIATLAALADATGDALSTARGGARSRARPR
jgi:hypothetical protein